MAEPTPGRPGGSGPTGPRSATAATFQVNDASLRDLHTTWRSLIKDVKEFNQELQNLGRGAKSLDAVVAKLGAIGGGRGGSVIGTVASAGGRMPGMPPAPVHLGSTIPVGSRNYRPPLAGQGGVPNTPGGGGGDAERPPLAGGSSPWKKRVVEGAVAGIAAESLFYQRRMSDISDADLFFNQQGQNTGYGYRGADKSAARNTLFGRPGGGGFGGGVTGYQSVQDLLGGASTVFGATGGRTGGRGMAQLRAAGQLASLTPNAGLAGAGQAVAGLYDPTMSARLNTIGAGPSVGLHGQLSSPQQIYQRVLQVVYRGQRPTAQMITEGLQPGAPLYVTLTQGLGLGPDTIEQFARYAIAQANLGGDFARTNRALADASRGRITADTRRAGLTESIRSRQNLAGAAGARQTVEAGREAEGTLMKGFSTLASVTDDLTNAFKRLNDVSGGASGNALGLGAMAGGPIQSGLNAVGGVGGGMFALQTLRSMRGARGAAGLARGGGVAAGAEEAGAVGAGGELAAVAGPVGIAIAAAFVAHVGGEALKGQAAGKKGLVGAVEDIVGQHLSSSWKTLLPGGQVSYAKDLYGGVRRHAGWLPKLPGLPGFAGGGVVPGQHDRDDVPIRATPGELVVPRHVVRGHGGADALMRRLGFEGRSFGGHYANGGEVTGDVQGLNGDFLKRLKAWSAYVGQPFVVGSGYRSMEEQKVLYDRWMRRVPGQARAAKPGSSNHNFGLAADGPHWADKHPEKFGLVYPMSFEPWHVEPIGAKGQRGAGGGAGSVTDGGDGADLGRATGAGASPGNIANAPGVLASESSAMAAFLGHANNPYGTGQAPTSVSTPPPNASGLDSTTATASVQHAPENASGNVALGRQRAAARGWTGNEWDALYQLWNKESGWRTNATNPNSSARGIAQTMMSVHFGKNWQHDKRATSFLNDPMQQIEWGLNYISQRYSKPSAAWAHSQKMNWYEQGAWQTDDEVARLHRDEMVVPAPTARKLRQMVRNRGAGVQGSATPMSGGHGKVEVNISMPVQVVGPATVQDARHLVNMMKTELEQDETLMLLGSGS